MYTDSPSCALPMPVVAHSGGRDGQNVAVVVQDSTVAAAHSQLIRPIRPETAPTHMEGWSIVEEEERAANEECLDEYPCDIRAVLRINDVRALYLKNAPTMDDLEYDQQCNGVTYHFDGDNGREDNLYSPASDQQRCSDEEAHVAEAIGAPNTRQQDKNEMSSLVEVSASVRQFGGSSDDLRVPSSAKCAAKLNEPGQSYKGLRRTRSLPFDWSGLESMTTKMNSLEITRVGRTSGIQNRKVSQYAAGSKSASSGAAAEIVRDAASDVVQRPREKKRGREEEEEDVDVDGVDSYLMVVKRRRV